MRRLILAAVLSVATFNSAWAAPRSLRSDEIAQSGQFSWTHQEEEHEGEQVHILCVIGDRGIFQDCRLRDPAQDWAARIVEKLPNRMKYRVKTGQPFPRGETVMLTVRITE